MLRLACGALLVLAFASAAEGPIEPNKPSTPLSAKQLDSIWNDLAEHDDAGTQKARSGMRALAGEPKLAVPFLKQRLRAVPSPDAKTVAQCLTDLEAIDFKTRENAAKQLEAIGPLASPAVEKKLTEKLPLDTQRRLEMLLEKMERNTLSGDELRTLRGIEVLQNIGSVEAVDVLHAISAGADGAVTTLQAKKALVNLTK
ncbi:MAG: hypothetical protein K2R98_08250 [Gemmataceae bacterium]|nr:hypothetical protein [Gemmataceae bacterium]